MRKLLNKIMVNPIIRFTNVIYSILTVILFIVGCVTLWIPMLPFWIITGKNIYTLFMNIVTKNENILNYLDRAAK